MQTDILDDGQVCSVRARAGGDAPDVVADEADRTKGGGKNQKKYPLRDVMNEKS